MINPKFSLENTRNLNRIDNRTNEGSGWIVELIESQYINISTYRPLSGSSYVKLPAELRSSKQWLINIKNNEQKCFLWCNAEHIIPVKIHPERITRNDKKLANDLKYDGIEFSLRERDCCKIERKNNICINMFCYENKLTFPIYVLNQNSMDLLLVTDGDKSN